ncbi:MAG: hypothetical protein ACO1RX_20555 [Candidatus Sericytochromatia bacterium]
MKTGFFYTACALSLALSACQSNPPVLRTGAPQTARTTRLAPTLPLKNHPALRKAEASGSVRLAGQTLTLTLVLPPLHQHSAFTTQKLDLSGATQLVAQVSDSHGKTYAPVGANGDGAVNYSAGTVTLTFQNVVPDELLFVEVQAHNGTTPIPQASLATVLKHTRSTSPVSTTINFQTSVAARTLKALLPTQAERARALDLGALETLTATITGVSGTAPNLSYADKHPSLVNTALLATQLVANDPASLLPQAASFRQAGASVQLTLAGLNDGDQVQVQITDAASAIQSALGNGTTTLTGLTPGSGLTALVSPFGTPAQTYTYTLNPSPLTLTEGATTHLTLTATPELNRLYVNDNATGNNNGSSWTDAYTSLQTALAAAGPGDEIWVAEGTYTPHASDSSVSFVMKEDVAIYGGFAGTETELSERSPSLSDFVSVLSGDLSGNDDPMTPGTTRNENAYHVVKGANNAILDGFTIQDGNARGSANADKSGGGMYNNAVSPTLSNVILDSNTANQNGGGMYNTSASPSLTQVTLSNNSSNNAGGGIYNQASSPILTQVRFSHNETGYTGGGMYESIGSSSSLTDVDFDTNLAQQHGGGIYTSGNATLTNVTFVENTAYSRGGGLYSSTLAAPTLKNVVFANNFAPHDGGGWFIFRDASASTASHVTFVNNRIDANSDAFGSRAVANEGPIPSFQNMLFWNNSARAVAPGQGGNVFAASDPFVDSATPYGADGIPRTADDGLRISPLASEVLNAGIDAGVLKDILNRDRPGPGNANAEPGAYEYTP